MDTWVQNNPIYGQASAAYIDYLHTQCVSTEHDNGRDNNEHKHQSKLSEKINLNSYSSSDFWWDAFGSFDSDTESLFMVQIINCEMCTILLEQICTLLCWLIRPIADLRAPKKTRLGRWRWVEFMMLVVVCRAWQWCWLGDGGLVLVEPPLLLHQPVRPTKCSAVPSQRSHHQDQHH